MINEHDIADLGGEEIAAEAAKQEAPVSTIGAYAMAFEALTESLQELRHD